VTRRPAIGVALIWAATAFVPFGAFAILLAAFAAGLVNAGDGLAAAEVVGVAALVAACVAVALGTGLAAVGLRIRANLRRLKHSLTHRARTLDAVVNASDDLVALIDDRGNIEMINSAGAARYGKTPAEMVGRTFSDVLSPDEIKIRIEAGLQAISRGAPTRVLLRRGDGWTDTMLAPVFNSDGTVNLAIFGRDVTELKRARDEADHLAHFDALTDLPNRRSVLTAVQTEIRKAGGVGRFALLFIDLDRFKFVNDTFGHIAGDQCLKIVAQRLARAVRDVDTVGRFGGDEFVALLSHVDRQLAMEIAQRIVALVSEPVRLGEDIEVAVGATIGVAVYPDDAAEADGLITLADTAMYHGKDGEASVVPATDVLSRSNVLSGS
jgi:diguanylate cyclase (GGDEF)-like protein/PAS domain S-box-containing protein